MRIFQAIDSSTTAHLPGNHTWYRNLYDPLIEMGHDIVLFSTRPGIVAQQRNDRRARGLFSQQLLATFLEEHNKKPFQLFFAYLMDKMIEPGAIDEIRKRGVPTVNFSCNNTHQFYLVKDLSTHFDYNLHAEKDAREKFLAVGATPLWWPMASNPKYFKPVNCLRSIPVSFVGENYALRARYIAFLLEKQVEVHAFGPGWLYGSTSQWRSRAKRVKYLLLAAISTKIEDQLRFSSHLADHDFRRSLALHYSRNLHNPVSDDELIALYSRSQISLGFLEVYDEHDPSKAVLNHLHLREFEAPMSGALYCTGRSAELSEFFIPDQEVLTYSSPEELVDKIRFFLDHPIEAEKIRAAGLRRALADHTYQRRFMQLFQALNLLS